MHKHAESDGQKICEDCVKHPMEACSKHPHINQDITLGDFLMMVKHEVFRARLLFPSCEGVGMAMLEEVGEVANAYLDEERKKIVREGVQACAMVARFVLEGDPSLAALREKRGLDK